MDIQTKIPIAVEKHTKLDLPFDHASTSMFMLLQPMYYRHTLRTENNHFKFTSVVRPNPLVVPTFGRIRQNLRHFFVPYRLVFPNWEEYKQDVVASNFESSSQVVGVPCFDAQSLQELFFGANTGYGLSVQVTTPTTEPLNYDFIINGSYYKLTRLGRNLYKILYSLGYDIVLNAQKMQFNALILLAYAKVYSDWYANSAYLDDAMYLKLQRFFKYNDPTDRLTLTVSDLYQLLMFIRPAVYSSNPYFEDAWDNPAAPNGNQFTSFTFYDPTNQHGAYVSTVDNGAVTNGTPNMYLYDASSTQIGTKYMHDALQKLSLYQRRHALAGARSIDRVLAQYGIQTANLRLQRSIYVGVSSQDVDINSIYATANGTNSEGSSVVGDFAGAGFGAGSNEVQYQNDEEGIFLTISTLQPSGGYYQGYDRNNRHLTREQFYTPEFDTLGVQSIERGEVYVSRNGSFASDGDDYAAHFGFTGRYGEYKRPISRVSGDFSFPSVLAGGHAWHLMREFNDEYFNNSLDNVRHTQDFSRGTDAEQYMRLFTYTKYDLDPFNLFLHVDVASYAPCHPLTDSFDWDLNTPEVSINSQGSKVN